MPDPSRRRTGLPDVDPLIDVHETEQGTLDEMITLDAAESAVAAVRRDDLVAEQDAALRRWRAAKGRLTRAQRDGGAETIAAARERVTAASAEFDRISDAVLGELATISQARHDSVGEIYGQIRRSWDADAAVTTALARSRATGGATDDGPRGR